MSRTRSHVVNSLLIIGSLLLSQLVYIPIASAVAYNIEDATFSRIALSVAAQETQPRAMIFNNDGTKLYVMGFDGDDINEYTLSTPYDIFTATFTRIALSVGAQESVPYDMIFNNDGTKLYVMGPGGQDINEYTLSTPYDIASGSFAQIALSLGAQESSPNGFIFNNDGTKLYVLGPSNDDIDEYTLSTPYDIASGSFAQIALSVAAQDGNPTSLTFNNDGTKLYVMGSSGDDVNEYTLSTPYDIASGSFAQIALDVSGQDVAPTRLLFNNNGSKLYILGIAGVDINEYSITTDETSPTVALTAPEDGVTVSGASVTLSATSTDETAMGGVRFFINGTAVGSEDTNSPYSIVWDSTATSSGTKTLVAVARDAAGNIATSSSRTITVDNTPDPTAPTATASSTGTTLSWSTENAGSTRLFYGLITSTATRTPETNTGGSKTTSHEVSLNDLPSCTFYRYVTVNNSGIDIATSTERTFQTGCTGSATISTSTSEAIMVAAGGSVTHGDVTLTIPSGVTSTTTDVVFQINTVDASAVTTAVGTPNNKTNIGGIYHLKAVYNETETLEQFEEAVEVTLSYADEADDVDTTSLFVGRYEGGEWHNMGGVIDTVAKTITATTSVVEGGGGPAFSDWGIFGDELPEPEEPSSSGGGMSITPFVTQVRNLFAHNNLAAALSLMQNNFPITLKYSDEILPIIATYLQPVPRSTETHTVRDLELGIEGSDVQALQEKLIALGYTIPSGATGYFGPQTRAALTAYQTEKGITPAAGYYGPITRAHMEALLSAN